MADRPSSENIKAFTQETNSLLNKANSLLQQYNYASKLAALLEHYQKDLVFQNIIDRKIDKSQINDRIRDYIKAIFNRRQGQHYWDELNDYYNRMTGLINDCRNDLSVVKSSLKWAFSGKEKKENAVNAFLKVEEAVKSFNGFVEKTDALFQSVLNTPEQDVLNDYDTNKAIYTTIITELKPNLSQFTTAIPLLFNSEADGVIERSKDLLQEYNFGKQLSDIATPMKETSVFGRIIKMQLADEADENLNQQLSSFISALFNCYCGQRYWDELYSCYRYCLTWFNSYKGYLIESISNQEPLPLEKKNMKGANESFSKVKEQIDELKTLTEKTESMFNFIVNTSKKEALDSFEKNKGEYYSIISERMPELLEFKTLVPLLKTAESVRDTVLKQNEISNADLITAQTSIKSAAQSFNNEEINKELDKVPISELGKFGTGLKISALERNGYKTVGSIIGMPYSRLTSIYGIGEVTADSIYRAANYYANYFKDSYKARLNADNKTRKATNLLKNVAKYNFLRRKKEDLQKLVTTCEQDIGPRADKIKECLNNGIGWFFTTPESQKKYKTQYAELQNDTEHLRSLYLEFRDDIQKVNNITDEEVWQNFQNNPILFFTILEELGTGLVTTEDSTEQLQDELREKLSKIEIHTEGLNCTLRRYQEWGVRFALALKKVLLGDEMGLGKTIQALAVMNSLKNEGSKRFLVICPLSVLINWCREIETNSNFKVYSIYGKERLKNAELWKQKGGVGVTTYETLNSIPLWDTEIDQIVVDEAHYIKNPEANRTYNVRKVCQNVDRILLMTGTALENKVDEMISLISVLDRGLSRKLQNMPHFYEAPQFREAIKYVYFRRKRADVLSELPELIENKEWCSLSREEEERYYATLYSGNYSDVRKVSWNVGSLNQSSKARRMMEILEDAKDDSRKVLIFSFFRQTLDDIKAYIGGSCYGPINGSIPSDKRQGIIDQFNAAPAGSALAAQIIAGGTGLNIQSASVVIICEPQWKPSTENQAISRAYRMGQPRNVHVHRLLCEDTVDEKITDLLRQKQQIFDTYADKSIAAEKVAIDNRSFGNIIKEELSRLGNKYNSGEGVPARDPGLDFHDTEDDMRMADEDYKEASTQKHSGTNENYYKQNSSEKRLSKNVDEEFGTRPRSQRDILREQEKAKLQEYRRQIALEKEKQRIIEERIKTLKEENKRLAAETKRINEQKRKKREIEKKIWSVIKYIK